MTSSTETTTVRMISVCWYSKLHSHSTTLSMPLNCLNRTKSILAWAHFMDGAVFPIRSIPRFQPFFKLLTCQSFQSKRAETVGNWIRMYCTTIIFAADRCRAVSALVTWIEVALWYKMVRLLVYLASACFRVPSQIYLQFMYVLVLTHRGFKISLIIRKFLKVLWL